MVEPGTRFTYIYGLTDPRTREIRYVGKANNPKSRLAGHLHQARLGKPWHVSNWLRELLDAGLRPALTILDEVSVEGWQEAEIEWIRKLRADGAKLTNTAEGGLGGFSAEVLDRVHAAHRGRSPSEETRKKMREAKLGVKKSPEHVEAVRRALTGRTGSSPSVETRARISHALKNRTVSVETRERMTRARRGRANWNQKLSEVQVQQVRTAVASGRSRKEVAIQYGVSYSTVVDIVLKRRWAHI